MHICSTYFCDLINKNKLIFHMDKPDEKLCNGYEKTRLGGFLSQLFMP
ncbi:hypothetical protein O23A_p3181 [Aeromonas salmonicida]|nr:hypothetical protein O23A_p3181 [Aeromonas salmonicida]